MSDIVGDKLIGREVLICWDDEVWYDAVVVTYCPMTDMYKLVYREDKGIETTTLLTRRWMLAPKKKARPNKPVLDGAIVEFEHPNDGHRYKCMIYSYSPDGKSISVAYIDTNDTQDLIGGGWEFLTSSPCCDSSEIHKNTTSRARRSDRRQHRTYDVGIRKSHASRRQIPPSNT